MKRWPYLMLLLLTCPVETALAQTRPATSAPTGFTIRLDAPEEVDPDPEIEAVESAANSPKGETLPVQKKKKKRATKAKKKAKRAERARRLRKARAAKKAKKKAKRRRAAARKARKKAKRKARRDARRKARARKAAKRKARAAKRRARAEKKKKRAATRLAHTAKKVRSKAPQTKRAKKRRQTRRNKNRTQPEATPFLNGFGADFGRRTAWGVVEAVDVRTAARIRGMVEGEQRTYEQPVVFEPFRARLTPDTTGMLAALSDYLKATGSVMLVMIEGHAQDFEDPARDHTLSEARASAVREFLVKRGIDANRAIAYGVGRSQPSSDQAEANQRVLLHLVSGTTVRRPAARTWNQLTIARLAGDQNAFVRKSIDADWAPALEKLQLGSPAWIKTDALTDVVLRAPNASRYQVNEQSEIHIERAQFSPDVAMVEMTLKAGQINAINDPNFTGRGDFTLRVADAEITGTSMNILARTISPKRGWISVIRGVATVRLTSGLSMKIGAGQSIHLEDGQPSVWAQLEAPVVTGPTHGEFDPVPVLSWQPVRGAVAYRVEVAKDVDFHRVVKRQSITSTQLDIADAMERGKKVFWRVMAIDERASPGRFSKTFRVGRRLAQKSGDNED